MTTDHIYPLNDLTPHKLDGADCPCLPKKEQRDDCVLIVHNSFDGREAFEMKEPTLEQ